MDKEIISIVGISQSTNLTKVGCVGIDVVPSEHKIKIQMAREWDRDASYDIIAGNLGEMYFQKKWRYTYADYIIGNQLIKIIKKHLPIKFLTIKSKLVDTKDIEYMQSMDMAENSKYVRQLKNVNDIIWPTIPTKTVKEAMRQLPFFIEHITAAGTPSYYAEEKEYDHLTKGLMIAILGGRKFLESAIHRTRVVSKRKTLYHSTDDNLGSGLTGSQRATGKAHVQWADNERGGRYRIR